MALRDAHVGWGLLCVAAGAGVIAFVSFDFARDRRIVRTWSESEARVTRAEVRVGSGTDDSDSPDIEYIYAVGERAFTGTCCRHGLGAGDGDVRKFVADHYTGRFVPIYFNPEQPSESRMKADVVSPYGRTMFFLLVGGLFYGVGMHRLWWGWRARNATRPS